ncbi:MAG: hypothetical protein L3K02_05595 [Thermoplasmata archaeon]|nr:hypothetical protein [Thermoplasmata archaeon]
MTKPSGRPWQRLAATAGAFAIGDLIVGFAAFSSITLASLWYFSWEWIQLRAEYLAHGLAFGTAWQLGLAWFTVLAAFPLLVLTLFLAVRASEVPRRVYYVLRGGVRPVSPPSRRSRRAERIARYVGVRPDYLASFWNGKP